MPLRSKVSRTTRRRRHYHYTLYADGRLEPFGVKVSKVFDAAQIDDIHTAQSTMHGTLDIGGTGGLPEISSAVLYEDT